METLWLKCPKINRENNAAEKNMSSSHWHDSFVSHDHFDGLNVDEQH